MRVYDVQNKTIYDEHGRIIRYHGFTEMNESELHMCIARAINYREKLNEAILDMLVILNEHNPIRDTEDPLP